MCLLSWEDTFTKRWFLFFIFPLQNDGTNSLIGLLPCTTPPFSLHHTSFLLSYSIHLFIYYLPSPPLFFSICLQSVCTRTGFWFSLWGCCFFFLFQLHLSFILVLYVFHAGKGSSSCMQQGACSVWSCPIRDLIVWCYSPQPRGILSLSSSLTVIFLSPSLTTLSSSPTRIFLIWLLNLCTHSPELSLSFCSQPILSKFVRITTAETANIYTLT